MSYVKKFAVSVACLATFSGLWLPTTASAQPDPSVIPVVTSLEVVTDLHDFTENVAEDSTGNLLVTTGNGLYHVFTDGREAVKLFEAQSLGGVAIHGNRVFFAVGNDFAASAGSTLTGSIRSVDLLSGDEAVIATEIPAPNGLAILPDGTILYSTILGGYEGVHAVGDPVAQLYADVPTPNGLALDVGFDGALYIGSTLAMQVFRVDPGTRAVTSTGRAVIFCDDLTVVNQEIFAASVEGIWFPGALVPFVTDRPQDLLFDPSVPNVLGATSIKAARDGSLLVTTMSGRVLRIRL